MNNVPCHWGSWDWKDVEFHEEHEHHTPHAKDSLFKGRFKCKWESENGKYKCTQVLPTLFMWDRHTMTHMGWYGSTAEDGKKIKCEECDRVVILDDRKHCSSSFCKFMKSKAELDKDVEMSD